MPRSPEDYAGRVRAALPPFFDPVEVAAVLPSTMARAAELAETGAREGTTVVADAQSAGRGRLGRAWLAKPGTSLLISVVLRPGLAPARAWLVTAAAGVALVDATSDLLASRPGGLGLTLKWPNDLEAEGRKVAGMLAEARSARGRLESVLLGLGVNVGQGPDDFPPELTGRATSLSLVAGTTVDRVALLAGWAERFAAGYRALADGATGATLAAYAERLGTLGRQVRAELLGRDLVTGLAVGLGANGGLVIRTATGEVEVAGGDVEHLRTGERPEPVSRRP